MNANDLRLGNFLNPKIKGIIIFEEIHKVEPTTLMCILNLIDNRGIEFVPIKLTPEFFENNGYKRGETQKRFGNGYDYQPKDVFTEWFDFKINDNVTYRFSNWHYSSGVDNQDCLIWHDNEIRGCDFIHDFQNLFFALEGSEFVFQITPND